MKKIIICLSFCLFLILCSSCDNDFNEVKLKNETFYSHSELNEAEALNEKDLNNIDYSNNGDIIDDDIDFNEVKLMNGTFYPLKELYEAGVLNEKDLINIAYRNNYGIIYDKNREILEMPEVIEPIDELDTELLNLILQDYYLLLKQDEYFQKEPLDTNLIEVSVYCGTYNGYIALRLRDVMILATVAGEEIIDNYLFKYPYEGGNKVVLWKQNDLATYKKVAKVTLENYAENLKNNYDENEWNIVRGIVEIGHLLVDDAKNKTLVEEIFTTSITAIDNVEELESKLKADFQEKFGYHFTFDKFYGLYNGAAVFLVSDYSPRIKTVTISDIEFSYNYGWTIWVWKDGVFYNLEDIETIFAAKILTPTDLVNIAKIHADFYVGLDKELEK